MATQLSRGGGHEPFGETIRSGSPRRGLHDLDTSAGEHGVERRGELGIPVTDQEFEVGGLIAEVHQLPGEWVVPVPATLAPTTAVCVRSPPR